MHGMAQTEAALLWSAAGATCLSRKGPRPSPLHSITSRGCAGPLVRKYLLQNPHRVTVELRPDSEVRSRAGERRSLGNLFLVDREMRLSHRILGVIRARAEARAVGGGACDEWRCHQLKRAAPATSFIRKLPS